MCWLNSYFYSQANQVETKYWSIGREKRGWYVLYDAAADKQANNYQEYCDGAPSS